MQSSQKFLESIKSKQVRVGILGLGYVGLPLALRFSKVGIKVIGFDIDNDKISKLNEGSSYIRHIPSEEVQTALKTGFIATNNYSLIDEVDAIIICVPTPLTKHREPDLSFIISTMENIKPYLRKGHLVSLESTTYPGTTDEIIMPYLEEKNLKVGEEAFLIFSPEREDPANPTYTTYNIPKVCGGYSKTCLELGVALYKLAVEEIVPVSSTKTAEMTKLLENIHRAVNIGLVNEMKIIADRMGIDIHEVIRAASSKPFGFTPYYPGPGLGGHCIPIDPFYLTWKAKEFGVHTRFIELAGEVNASMPAYVIDKIVYGLNEKNKSLKGSKILVLGLAYKKNVDDARESPSVIIMEMLRDRGAIISYSDPYLPTFPKMREHHFNLSSVKLTSDSIAEYDCIVLSTDHQAFDYDMILKGAQLIVDTRGVYLAPSPKVIKA